ncbi:MAG: conjugative transfer protein GumN [Blastomonas sp. CACIA14H2]|uniref:TraB/GumN family protein n=1 Tax=Blastomonas sp. CACIA14H2 TaxID=1419876 RepID=UPI0003D04592|nr:MAG: conjugative transfer protein GumN [Blastomonas sp. CACIA14H2]
MNSTIARWLMLPLLLLIQACSGFPFLDMGMAAWDGPKKGTPALWHVEGPNGGEAWLFGGIHALPSDLKWISPKMKKAMDRSDRLVLEVVGLEDSAEITKTFQQLGNSPGQPPLADRLPPELRDKGEALRAASRLSPKRFETLESWAAAISLAGAATANLAMVREEGVERVLAARYRRRDKPVIGLETPARQFTYFDQLEEAEQRAMLESVIADADNAPRAYRDMVTAWLKGEPDKLAEAANRGLLQRPQIRERILVRRNRDWAAQIEDLLNLGARPFVAVGAAHLAGDDSVQALLESKGYTITRVQ